jgi:NAD(P)-dependent dehydrogenase (short-subunit alcohol dehydrogenase family)
VEAILITGANRGIGLELVRQYAGKNWRVFACCRSPDAAQSLHQLAQKSEGAISIHRLALDEDGQVDTLARELEGERIDILFNNAGIAGPRPQSFGRIDTGGWMRTFRVNALAPFQMAVAFVEHVARSERKIIATMGTLMGSLADNRSGGSYAYRSSKAAAHMVVRSLAADLRERGITAVVLHPGWVKTDLGGSGALIAPEESVRGLQRVLDSVTLQDSGSFFNYDGSELPW